MPFETLAAREKTLLLTCFKLYLKLISGFADVVVYMLDAPTSTTSLQCYLSLSFVLLTIFKLKQPLTFSS